MSRAFFICNNLKINPFILGDGPISGFSILAWDHEATVKGTLYDLGHDAGFLPTGDNNVEGQLWIAEDAASIPTLYGLTGVDTGFTIPYPINVKIHTADDEICETIRAVSFPLTYIQEDWMPVPSGRWFIRRK